MGRPNYVCTTCSEHFTRKYSAKRHNITVHHNNVGEIVTLVEYLIRRSSGKYQASDPSWYRRSSKEKRIHNFGHTTTVADSVEDALRTRALQRQQQGQYQYHQQSLEKQERHHRQQQEQSVSQSIPQKAIQDQPPPDLSPYPTDRTIQSQSMNTTDDEQTTMLHVPALVRNIL
jgi:cell division protein FtsN